MAVSLVASIPHLLSHVSHRIRCQAEVRWATRRLATLALVLARLAARRPDAGPHREKERPYSDDLGEAPRHHRRAEKDGIVKHTEQHSSNAEGRSRGHEPVRRFGDCRLIARIALLRPRKEPESDAENHHHDKTDEDGVGVRADDIRGDEDGRELSLHDHPSTKRHANRQEGDRGLEVSSNESMNEVPRAGVSRDSPGGVTIDPERTTRK